MATTKKKETKKKVAPKRSTAKTKKPVTKKVAVKKAVVKKAAPKARGGETCRKKENRSYYAKESRTKDQVDSSDFCKGQGCGGCVQACKSSCACKRKTKGDHACEEDCCQRRKVAAR